MNHRLWLRKPERKPLLYPAIHCFEEPFQARSLIDYYRKFTLPISNTYWELGHTFYHVLPCVFPTTKLSVSKQEWENAELNRPGTVNQPSAPYGIILPEPGIIRVSNMFIVLCFPLGCFMPCQPHGVVSDISSPFT